MADNRTKANLIQAVLDQSDLSKEQAIDAVDACFEEIKKMLGRGDSVKIPNFGVFTVRSKHARIGRNPKSGEEIEVTARKVVTFRPSQKLKERVR